MMGSGPVVNRVYWGSVSPILLNLTIPTRRLEEDGLPYRIEQKEHDVFVNYDAFAVGSGYVSPVVRLEFGARSTGEPYEPRPVVCLDHARYVDTALADHQAHVCSAK